MNKQRATVHDTEQSLHVRSPINSSAHYYGINTCHHVQHCRCRIAPSPRIFTMTLVLYNERAVSQYIGVNNKLCIKILAWPRHIIKKYNYRPWKRQFIVFCNRMILCDGSDVWPFSLHCVPKNMWLSKSKVKQNWPFTKILGALITKSRPIGHWQVFLVFHLTYFSAATLTWETVET